MTSQPAKAYKLYMLQANTAHQLLGYDTAQRPRWPTAMSAPSH